jgi:membrane-bound metal-dependent hydrolase YbcI (DUF457 family)
MLTDREHRQVYHALFVATCAIWILVFVLSGAMNPPLWLRSVPFYGLQGVAIILLWLPTMG